MNLDSYGGTHSYRAYWAVYQLVYWRVLKDMLADSVFAGIEVSNLAEKILKGVNHGGFQRTTPIPHTLLCVRICTTPN
jgi:hypothetical protein